MQHQIRCIIIVLLLLKSELNFANRHLCKSPGCNRLNTLRAISISRPRQYSITDNSIDYDDKHVQFKHFPNSKQSQQNPFSLKASRHIPDIRARHGHSRQNTHSEYQFNTHGSPPQLMPRREVNLPPSFTNCLRCETFPSEPHCGTDRNDYENNCYRECWNSLEYTPPVNRQVAGARPPEQDSNFAAKRLGSRPRVDILLMGKCPTCNCREIVETECAQPGSADNACRIFCHKWEQDYDIDCRGHKLTNGPCICPKKDKKVVNWVEVCGSDGKMYYDDCRRDCAGVVLAHNIYCRCDCTYVWSVLECGKDLGFEPKFSKGCLEKCRKERVEVEKDHFIGCQNSTKYVCKCPLEGTDSTPVCGHDHVLYPYFCALRCADQKPQIEFECPKCNCVASIWSKECGATDFLPIDPGCHDECSKKKLLLAKKRLRIVCNTKTSRKACVCHSSSKKECGTNGETYDNACDRRCQDGGDFAYLGECVTR